MSSKRVAKQKKKKKAAKRQLAKKPRGLQLFYKETVGELRRVSWPTKKEAVGLTKVVVLVMFVMAIFFWATDAVFFKLIGALFSS